MSELMNARKCGLRHQLLTTVSALALLAAVYGSGEAQAADQDADRPTLWIELGGSFSNLSDKSEILDPAFLSTYAPNGLKSPLFVEHAPRYGFDEDAKISFQPDGSDWVLSVAMRYGRTGRSTKLHQQFENAGIVVADPPSHNPFGFSKYVTLYPYAHNKFADASGSQGETHSIVDFEVGKDVGLGLFGLDGSSVVSAGVRVAQFSSKQNVNLNAQPDLQYPTAPVTNWAEKYVLLEKDTIRFHNYSAQLINKENFRGLGPKIDWNASIPVAGNEQNGDITLDWGANFAVLFGRQTSRGNRKTAVQPYYATHAGYNKSPGLNTQGRFTHHVGGIGFGGPALAPYTTAQTHNRSRMVAIPNLGGFVGISLKYTNAKVSFGYRADEFFNAMDGGLDSRKSSNLGLFGPYANISIGFGG